MSLVMFAIAPIFMINNALQSKFSSGFAMKTNDMTKEADLLCSDAINNFRTI